MTTREIIKMPDVGLMVNEDGDYIAFKSGHKPYKLDPTTRTYAIIKILDTRCLAQQRRYENANELISHLESKLESIENSKFFKIFNFLNKIF